MKYKIIFSRRRVFPWKAVSGSNWNIFEQN